MATDTSAVLTVESGVHRAARAALAAGRTSVGRAATDAIVVSDLDTDGTCFALDYRGGSVVVHAVGAPVEFFRRRTLKRGQARRCGDGLRFTSGGVTFKLEIAARPSERRTAPAPFAGRSRLPAFAATVLVAAAMIVLVVFRAAPAVMHAADAGNPVETTGSLPPSAPTVSARQKQSAALERLRTHLAEIGLTTVTLTARPDGSIEARGRISKAQEAVWQQAERWFDMTTAGRIVLVNAVGVGAKAPQPLAVQAVWPGRNPYVIDGDGNKRFIGSTLPSGWRIAGIDATRVLLERGHQTLAVRF